MYGDRSEVSGMVFSLTSQSCKTRKKVLNTCASSLTTSNACLQMFDCCTYASREERSVCLKDAFLLLTTILTTLVFSPKLKVLGNEELLAACAFFANEMIPLSSTRCVNSWTVPVGLVAVETLALLIMRFNASLYNVLALLGTCQNITTYTGLRTDVDYSAV